MGLQKKERMTFLRISDGKIRMKTTKEDPEAEERYDNINQKFLYERVYTDCEGYLTEIRVQTHETYGTSYSMILFDPTNNEKFSLSIAEESRYFQSLCMFMPNVDFSKPLNVKPYSFTKDNRRNIGVSFEQDNAKVKNYYKDYDIVNGEIENVQAKNGLENFDFSEVADDKDEMKILRLKLMKFLKGELKKQIIRLEKYVETNKPASSDNGGDNAGGNVEEEKSVNNKSQKKTSSKTKKSTKQNTTNRRKKSGRELPF